MARGGPGGTSSGRCRRRLLFGAGRRGRARRPRLDSPASSCAAFQSPVLSSQSARERGDKSGGSSPRAAAATERSSVTGSIYARALAPATARPPRGQRLAGPASNRRARGSGSRRARRARRRPPAGLRRRTRPGAGSGFRAGRGPPTGFRRRRAGGRRGDAQVGLAAAGVDDPTLCAGGAFERAHHRGPDRHHPPVARACLGDGPRGRRRDLERLGERQRGVDRRIAGRAQSGRVGERRPTDAAAAQREQISHDSGRPADGISNAQGRVA